MLPKTEGIHLDQMSLTLYSLSTFTDNNKSLSFRLLSAF